MRKISILVFTFVIQLYAFAQGVVVKNATIHVGNGTVIENGILVTEKDKIVYAGNEKDCTGDLSKKEIIDSKGSHIYPGFISMFTSIGLIELEAVRASADHAEIGELNPHIRANVAYNVDSDILPTLCSNGILTAQITPRGGLITGSSSAMYLSGWTWEEAQIKADEGIHVNWPGFYPGGGASDAAKNEHYDNRNKAIERLKLLFLEAKNNFNSTSTNNLRLQALYGLFDESRTLYVTANSSKEVLEVIAFTKEAGVKKVVIVGARDALSAAEEIKKSNISSVLARLHETPSLAESDVDYNYKLAYEYKKRGIKVALTYYGEMEAAHSRNLAFIAGTAAKYGLTKEEALACITSVPAEMMGISKIVGTLEKDKQASFIISKGDVLDMKTNIIQMAFIKGTKLDLTDKQKALNQKYVNKYKLN